MNACQLALPWWTLPEQRAAQHQLRLVPDDDPPQISFAEWLFAFRTGKAVQFCGIPTAILLAKARWHFTQAEHRVLTALLIEIYQFMEDNAAARRIAWGRLCWLTGIRDRATVGDALRSLEELHIIRVTRRGTRSINTYAINPPEEWLAKSSSSRGRAASRLSARVVRVQ